MIRVLGRFLVLALLVAGCSSPAAIEPSVPSATEAAPASSSSPDTGTPIGADSPTLSPTACEATLTQVQTEGPYYTPGSPERSDLVEPGIPGTPLLVTGVVMDAACVPIAGARIDFWQADGAGEYDNLGFRLRGNQLTGADGSYRLETVIPGVYPGRTPHIHVKIFAPDGRELLTTQLYLRGISDQIPDGFFDAALLADDQAPEPDGRRHVSFDFVVEP